MCDVIQTGAGIKLVKDSSDLTGSSRGGGGGQQEHSSSSVRLSSEELSEMLQAHSKTTFSAMTNQKNHVFFRLFTGPTSA